MTNRQGLRSGFSTADNPREIFGITPGQLGTLWKS